MKEDVVSMAYALRRYNARFDEANAGQRIILQDVLEDWASMKYDLYQSNELPQSFTFRQP